MNLTGLSQLFYPLDMKWRLPGVTSHVGPKGKLCVLDLPRDPEIAFSLGAAYAGLPRTPCCTAFSRPSARHRLPARVIAAPPVNDRFARVAAIDLLRLRRSAPRPPRRSCRESERETRSQGKRPFRPHSRRSVGTITYLHNWVVKNGRFGPLSPGCHISRT